MTITATRVVVSGVALWGGPGCGYGSSWVLDKGNVQKFMAEHCFCQEIVPGKHHDIFNAYTEKVNEIAGMQALDKSNVVTCFGLSL